MKKQLLPIFRCVFGALCLLYSSIMIAQVKKDTTSYIQMLDIESGKIDTVLVIKSHFEAPNWHPDNYL